MVCGVSLHSPNVTHTQLSRAAATLYLCIILVVWRTSTIDLLAFKLAATSSLPLFAFFRHIISIAYGKDDIEDSRGDTEGNTAEDTRSGVPGEAGAGEINRF